eukprot:CAMPEP_0113944050 /NCGR_PEP_ID=MMETSP1339-20121228/30609_1 /TAXON_ID=94617 /ORGANISM="Fibrocapsa japonica" /LENGTH=100 /DNA_ID=CAMNT_0000949111 /DNA_START=128 /DNA_END=427 /DNA_ORIENTATION=+ /assembly_acc=CAM_ASM_000762
MKSIQNAPKVRGRKLEEAVDEGNVDCVLTQWMLVEACPEYCFSEDDQVVQLEVREVVVEPVGDGLACGELSRSKACPPNPCRHGVVRPDQNTDHSGGKLG